MKSKKERPPSLSSRTDWDLTPNLLSSRRDALQQAGVDVLDLTESNPTRCGFSYPPQLLESLRNPKALSYEPDPKGLLCAREAVASIYAAKGVQVDPGKIVLTASTSEAYSFLFRLLCDPSDQVLVPNPSYPLFDYLARLSDVEPVSYPLVYNGRWRVSFDSLLERLTPRTKALVMVHPNNPTGSCVTKEECAMIVRISLERGVPIISDEVFAEYLYAADPAIPRTLAGAQEPLIFSLGGLSKFMGLPQMKLGWIVASGPPEVVSPVLERLEVIADTALSVNAPVQLALPHWLTFAGGLQSKIRQRVLANRRFLMERLAGGAADYLHADGGWSAVLRVASLEDEESQVVNLLEKKHLLVHPGYFFDFQESGILVVSLIVPPERFRQGIEQAMCR